MFPLLSRGVGGTTLSTLIIIIDKLGYYSIQRSATEKPADFKGGTLQLAKQLLQGPHFTGTLKGRRIWSR